VVAADVLSLHTTCVEVIVTPVAGPLCIVFFAVLTDADVLAAVWLAVNGALDRMILTPDLITSSAP
jgi:hypothetical protein